MDRLSTKEVELLGCWITTEAGVQGDSTCERIDWLTSESLELVGVDKESGGWAKLFRDPADGRYWLKWYPQGERQGGGPPALKHLALSDSEVQRRFVPVDQWKKESEEFLRKRNIRFVEPDESAR